MNDNEINKLKEAVKDDNVHFISESGRYIKILSIVPPIIEFGEPEPSECALLEIGGYLALYNCNLSEFIHMSTKPIV